MGFGFSNSEAEKIPSTPYTRCTEGGTIAQLFTTIAVLQRVELGHH